MTRPAPLRAEVVLGVALATLDEADRGAFLRHAIKAAAGAILIQEGHLAAAEILYEMADVCAVAPVTT